MCVTLRPFIRLSKQSIIALTIVILLVGCGGNDETATPPIVDATPAAGGMVMPTSVDDGETPPLAEAATTLPTVSPIVALLIGDVVVAKADQELRLYNDATASAMVMSVYDPGAQLTVLDASGEYASYPVEREGQLWYRLRAPDGLVGWGAADQITPLK